MDKLSQQEMTAAGERALTELQLKGIQPRDIWSDPNMMTEFIVVAHRQAGCEHHWTGKDSWIRCCIDVRLP